MYHQELHVAKDIVNTAARIALRFYGKDTKVTVKEDASPVTKADIAVDEYIFSELSDKFPEDAILSEEREKIDISSYERVWVIDPLDGTKEFIKQNGEFTINIALLVNGKPVVGVISVPAKKDLYWASSGGGAYKNGRQIKCSKRSADLVLVHSRSHMSPEVARISKKSIFAKSIPGGSSVKGCLVAEGSADVYVRFGIMEWDICAMHCIVIESGAMMTNLRNKDLTYGNPNFYIDGFIVSNAKVFDKISSFVQETFSS